MGKKAEEWSELTNDNNYKFAVKHPASAAYNGSKWNSNNIFNKILFFLDEFLFLNSNKELLRKLSF